MKGTREDCTTFEARTRSPKPLGSNGKMGWSEDETKADECVLGIGKGVEMGSALVKGDEAMGTAHEVATTYGKVPRVAVFVQPEEDERGTRLRDRFPTLLEWPPHPPRPRRNTRLPSPHSPSWPPSCATLPVTQ